MVPAPHIGRPGTSQDENAKAARETRADEAAGTAVPGSAAERRSGSETAANAEDAPAFPTSDAHEQVPAADSQDSAAESATAQAPGEESEENRTQAIDETLARFSAVHDEIAEEEAKRRSRYAWLLGQRKEPEPGKDMPFDFVEGRDAQASRIEWKQQQRRKRTVRTLKGLAVAAAVMVFIATGIGWSAKAWVDAKFREIAALDPNSAAIQNAAMQDGDVNFLLVGSDTRMGKSGGDGAGTAKATPGARSDTTMIAHIPADRSRVVIVSIPRDLEVDLPSCEEWNPRTGNYTGRMLPPRENVKFNVAYATGGPKCTTKVVQRISGLSITNFLGINFAGFKDMVNAVNGVRICTRTPIVDSVLGPILPEAGTYKLNGEQALKYVRARHVQGDPTADYGRMQRQQLFLSALLRKVMSAEVLLDIGKLTGFVNAVAANTFGDNISTDALIGLGQSLQGLDPNKVTFVTVPTTGTANERGNEELRAAAADALFRAIIRGTPITPSKSEDGTEVANAAATSPMSQATAGSPQVQARPASTEPAVETAEVTVEVLNTTEEAGLAGRTADKLRELGYSVTGVGNLASDTRSSVIRYSAGNKQAAELLATSLPDTKLVRDDSVGDVVQLALGTGFGGSVYAPDPGPPEVPENLATVNAGKDVCGGVG